MNIINISQRSPEWIEWRKNGIGATDIASIMGRGSKKAIDIYASKSGIANEGEYITEAMQRGIDCESEALQLFSSLVGEEFVSCCIEKDGNFSFMRASLDGYSPILEEIVEIKTPANETNWRKAQEKIDIRYIYQVQWQLMVSSAKKATLAFYSPELKQLFCKEILPDIELHAKMIEAAINFWEDLQKGIAPACGTQDLIEITEEEAILLAKELKEINRSKKELDEQERALKTQLMDFGDGGNFVCNGVYFKLMEGRATLDKEKLIANGIDISLYEKKSKDFWQMSIKI